MLSHKNKVIFIHVRKAGGTSIQSLFPDATQKFMEGVLSPEWVDSNKFYSEYFKFTVVRNPWDRFISGWRYCFSTQNLTIHEVLENLPEMDLCKNITAAGVPERVRKIYLDAYLNEAIYLKQREWRIENKLPVTRHPRLVGHDYRHLTRNQTASFVYNDGRVVVDAVINMEDLRNGLLRFSDRLGIDPNALPHRNKNRDSRLDDYRNIFDKRARELFEKVYEKDVAMLGYDFDAGPGVAPKNKIKL